MMVRTQIALDSEEHRRAKRRAAEQGISLAEYVRRAVRRDLGGEAERPKAHISEIFGLGSSGVSDVSRNKHRYVGEAVEAEYLRKTGRTKFDAELKPSADSSLDRR
jgi:hypothetical protein